MTITKSQQTEKEKYIDSVYYLLCKSQGQPANENECKKLRQWAASIYEMALEDSVELNIQIMSPKDAYDEEMSCI